MKVAILGCGYVGTELGRQLLPDHEVVGVRRSNEGCEALRNAGLEAIQADVTEAGSLGNIPAVDALVFAASSGGRDPDAAREVYVEGQRTVLEVFGSRANPPDRYLYTSSTGVYGDHDGEWVDEETPLDPATEKTEMLATAEDIALDEAQDWGMDGTVVRLAGIYGPGRYRVDRYLDGPVVAGFRNTIHRDDAAGAIAFLLEQDLARNDIVLVVDNEPVQRPEFAAWLADNCGQPEPATQSVAERLETTDSERVRRRLSTDKRCSNDKLRHLGYEMIYPTFREGYKEELESLNTASPD